MIALLLFPLSEKISNIIFNQQGKSIMFKLILFLVVGESLYVCLYSYYRGKQQILNANVLHIAIIGLLPVLAAVLLIPTHELSFFIFFIGLFFYMCLFSLLPKFISEIRNTSFPEIKTIFRKLLTYSIPRIPGGASLTLIFTFGVMISPYTGGIANAAYMSIGIWLFQILEIATNAFGLIVLPKVANFLGNGKEDYLINNLRSIYEFNFHIGIFLVIQFFLVIDFIILVWVGHKYTGAVSIARILTIAIIPYLFYTVMRNIIDAVEEKAINTYNLYISLIITILTSLILLQLRMGVYALAIGLDAGLITLGGLTYLFMKRRYNIRAISNDFYSVLAVNILLGFLIYVGKYKILSNSFNYYNLAIVILLQFLCAAIYTIFLNNLDVAWVKDIKSRIKL